jgi:hypothetical protein
MCVPGYLPYYVLAGSAAIIAALLLGLRRALSRAAWSCDDQLRVIRISTAVLIGWFGIAFALGFFEVYRAVSDRIPTLPSGILVPILIGGLLIVRSSTMARMLDVVPQHWLIGVQLYRALGAIFLILYGTGKMPGLFAWPAGLGDVLVGVLAPVVAVAYARGPEKNGDLVSAWNIFGMVDLIVAVATGFSTSPSPFQLFAFDQPNELVSVFPLVLIPTYLVPVSVLLHIASLKKLRRTVRHMEVQPVM